MKLVFNPQPASQSADPLPEGWNLIRQPGARAGLWIAILVGAALPFAPFMILTLRAILLPYQGGDPDATVPVWIVFPVLAVSIAGHELLHLLFHPGWGLSSRSLLLVWPGKVQFGVFYDGFMTRSRWLVMRLAPLLGLAALPTAVLLVVDPGSMVFFWRQFIVILILINCLGGGGDLAASLIVAWQVPPGAEIGIWNERACWKNAARQAIGSGAPQDSRTA